MRLFTGIALASSVVDRLSAAIQELRSAARINWSPVGNLHITTKFIGQWPEDRLAELKTALESVPVSGPFRIAVSRFGFFPNPHQPHSFFAGVQAAPALSGLAEAIDQTLAPLGCKPEGRVYRPHVTLARIKRDADIRTLRERIATMTDFEFGAFDALAFRLYLSKPGDRSSVYTELATYDLMREKNTNS